MNIAKKLNKNLELKKKHTLQKIKGPAVCKSEYKPSAGKLKRTTSIINLQNVL